MLCDCNTIRSCQSLSVLFKLQYFQFNNWTRPGTDSLGFLKISLSHPGVTESSSLSVFFLFLGLAKGLSAAATRFLAMLLLLVTLILQVAFLLMSHGFDSKTVSNWGGDGDNDGLELEGVGRDADVAGAARDLDVGVEGAPV